MGHLCFLLESNLSARSEKYSETPLEARDYIYSQRRLKLDHTKPDAKIDLSGVQIKLKMS